VRHFMTMLYTSGGVKREEKLGYTKDVIYRRHLVSTVSVTYNPLNTIRAYFCLVDNAGVDLLGSSTRVPSDESTVFLRKRRAFGPWRIKPSVQRDRPRRVSGWWTAAVRSVAKEVVNIILGMEM
jgi:hypothetical protein